MSSAYFIDESRLWQKHLDMAALGGYDEIGVNRQAFSDEDIQARQLMMSYAERLDLSVFVDPIGNLFFRYQPPGAQGAPVVCGSHADSQPTGGRFDGIYGVLAGFEAIEAILQSGVPLDRPIEVVAWSNEEGSRYAPGAMGSMVFTGERELEQYLDDVDQEGIRLGDELERCLAATPQAQRRELRYPMAAYVEAHVEQGPVLEESNSLIGVVTEIQGARWFEVELLGETRHAGSTPLRIRRDALQAAHRVIAALNEHFHDPDDVTRFTIGRFEVVPNSPNTVAEKVLFTIDFRHPDSDVIAAKGDTISAIAQSAALPCNVEVRETFHKPPVKFATEVVKTIQTVATKQGVPNTRISSGAFHDAMFLAGHCPTGMIFVPSRGGISHHPDEYTEPGQLAIGARVLSESLVLLANSPEGEK